MRTHLDDTNESLRVFVKDRLESGRRKTQDGGGNCSSRRHGLVGSWISLYKNTQDRVETEAHQEKVHENTGVPRTTVETCRDDVKDTQQTVNTVSW